MSIFNKKDVLRQACARSFVNCARKVLGRKSGTSGFTLLALLLAVVIVVVIFLVATSGVFKNPFATDNRLHKHTSRNQTMTEERLIGDIQRVLAAGGNIDAQQNSYRQTYLHIAAKYGFAKAVALCLDNGANIEACDYPAGMTPMHRAAFDGNVAVVKLLIDHGANVEAREMLGGTVLKSAITGDTNRGEIIALLMAAGADINARDRHMETPLFDAIREGQVDIATALLDKGADVTAKNVLGFTPLHQAAYKGQATITELLIEYGAELNARDNDGATPLDIAGGEVAKVLRAHGAKRGNEL
jgi:ankyrin repeat protein